MNTTLQDEITSINAIYTPDTFHPCGVSHYLCVLRIQCAEMSLRLSFPEEYPDLPPEILGPETSSTWNRKGEANEVADLAHDILRETFRSGEPCIYNLLEELTAKLQDQSESLQKDQCSQHDRATEDGHRESRENSKQQGPPEGSREVGKILVPKWSLSEVVAEKKSIFVARAAHVKHPTEAKLFVQHLINTDKKVAKATHNITAWRMRGSRFSDITFQDCDDDGETAAGGRLLHLLQVMDVWDVMIVVSRWYGGIQLGPDRFRIINYVARDALIRSGSEYTGKNDKNKKGQK